MKLPRRQILHLAAGAVALPAVSRIASAQAWPARPIRALATGGAGSAVDVISRVVFDQLSNQLGQPIIVENRVGAGGTIAVAAVAKAEPDGYTILANSSSLTVAPWLYAKLVAAAKAKPGSFNYTSTGVGSATHMGAERFRVSAGMEAVHVPAKSGPEALTEILSGRADFYLCPIATALPFIREGKLLGLVATGPNRAPELPDVPTTSEAGFTNADYTFWIGLFVPAKTPRDIVNRLHDETVKALLVPRTRARLSTLGVVPMEITPDQFDARIRDEIATNDVLVRAAGIKPE